MSTHNDGKGCVFNPVSNPTFQAEGSLGKEKDSWSLRDTILLVQKQIWKGGF